MRDLRKPIEHGRAAILLLVLLYGLLGAYSIYLAWWHLNLLQVDLAGHVASATVFANGGFHRYTDQFFQGYVHNLFYPPLEDLLLALAAKCPGADPVTGYRVYLSLLMCGFLGSIVWAALAFKSAGAKLLALLGMLLVVNLDKSSLFGLQGLSLWDVFTTGLSSEVLGACFLFLVLGLLLRDRPGPSLSLLVALALLSHLVAGPVVVLLALAWAGARKAPAILGYTALGAAMAGCFLIPFIVNRDLLYSATIFHELPMFIEILLIYALVLLRRVWRGVVVSGVGVVLGAPVMLHGMSMNLFSANPFPPFHYYRLGIFSLIMLVFALALLLEERRWVPEGRWMVVLTVALAAAWSARELPIAYYDIDAPQFTSKEVDARRFVRAIGASRTFVVAPGRPSDFYVGAIASAEGSAARFVKGLYWESSVNNTLLSSYLASLFSDTGIVLDYWKLPPLPCEVAKGLWDNFVADYDIEVLAVADDWSVGYLPLSRQLCYRSMLRSGTAHYRYRYERSVSLGGVSYSLYRVKARRGSAVQASIRVVDPGDVRALDQREPFFFSHAMKEKVRAAREGALSRETFVVDDAFEPAVVGAVSDGSGRDQVRVGLQRGGEGEWSVLVESEQPRVFELRLAYARGFSLTAESGENVPVFRTLGGMLAVGNGRMRLVYRRTKWMWCGYVSSAVGFVVWVSVAVGWRASRRRRDSCELAARSATPGRATANPEEELTHGATPGLREHGGKSCEDPGE